MLTIDQIKQQMKHRFGEDRMMEVEKLIPYVNNSRTHNDKQVQQIISSIHEWGFTNPVLIDECDIIIAGHGRVMASKAMGLDTVPFIKLTDLSDAQKKAYIIADNKLALNAGWDEEKLAVEIQHLGDLSFDIDLLGFDEDELNALNVPEDADDIKEDEPPTVNNEKEPFTKRGDLWVLGKHRLICGDSTDIADVNRIMDGEKADLLHTDPPYNVAYEGQNGMTIQNDSMEDSSFRQFLVDAFKTADANLKEGGAFYIWHADSEGFNFRGACRDVDWKVRQCLIWNKNALVMGRQDYQWKHEPCLYGWKEGAGHYWNGGRAQTTVFEELKDKEYKKFKKPELVKLVEELMQAQDPVQSTVIDCEKPLSNDLHPTMKPVKLCAKVIINSTQPGEIVLDLFGGSGSTMIACEQLGRRGYSVELDEKYADAIVKRYNNLDKHDIKLIRDGKEYDWKEIKDEVLAEV